MKLVLRAPQKCELNAIVVETNKLAKWKCVLLLASFCSDSPEGQSLSIVQHAVVLQRAFAGCMVTEEDTISVEVADERSVRDPKMIRGGSLKVASINTGSAEDKMK